MNDPKDERQQEGEASRSDLAASRAPGGPGQVEQVPGRGSRAPKRRTQADDAEIRRDVQRWLGQQDAFDPQQVEALVDSGVVVLLGAVPDYESKRSIESFVLGMRGVHEVHDPLRVERMTWPEGAGGLRTSEPRAGNR